MVDLWREFWIRETGTGQQVAQLHDRYMMMMMVIWLSVNIVLMYGIKRVSCVGVTETSLSKGLYLQEIVKKSQSTVWNEGQCYVVKPFVVRCCYSWYKAYYFNYCFMVLDSSVVISTRYGLYGPGAKSWSGRDFPLPYRTALEPTQSSVQWVAGSFPGDKETEAWRWTPTSLIAPRLKKE